MLKRFVSLLLVIVMVLPLCVVATNAVEEEYPPDDYKTWTQGDPRWGDYVYGRRVTPGKQLKTIRQTGCMITSIAVLMAYSDPSKRDWTTFNPMILARDHLIFEDNCIADYRVFNQVGGESFIFLGTETSSTLRGAAALVKPHMEAGDYTMVYAYKEGVYSHFSPVVGWNYERDEPILWDVGSANYGNEGYCEYGCCWNSKFPRAEGGIYYVISYKSLISSSQDTIFNTDSDLSEDLSEERQEELDEIGSLVIKEWELNGMPQASDLISEQLSISVGDLDKLGWNERLSSAVIGEAIRQNQKTAFDYIRISFVFAGILLIVYAILLTLGYVFDRSNSFIDISLLSIVTFGKIKVWYNDMPVDLKEAGYISPAGLFIRIAIIAIAGLLFVSGALMIAVYGVYSLLS